MTGRQVITIADRNWLSEFSLHALAIVDTGTAIRVVRTVGVLGNKNAMAALERMERGALVDFVTGADA